MNTFRTVFGKELKDALRDRRTLLLVMVTSTLAGPLMLILLSGFVASLEESAARREVFVHNAAAGPTLVNFLRRAGANVQDAPQDYRDRIAAGRLLNAVVVVPDDFEARLAAGETIRLQVTYDDTAARAQPAVRATLTLVRGFNRELGLQRLLARGVGPQVLTPLEVEEHNLATSQARGAQLLFMLPWAALMAALLGTLSVAIDVTAGERERGSLEPLLMNPVSTGALVLGKWAVVVICAVVIVLLTLLGLKIAMQFVRSENLAAMMHFEFAQMALFLTMLLPAAAMVGALNMLAATYGRSYKEAQTYVSYITTAVSFAPMVTWFMSVRDAPWQLAVPAIAQQSVMMRGLRGETVGATEILVPGAIALAITAVALVLQARLLRQERIVFSRSG